MVYPTCMAVEVGIIVVNKCLKRNIFINTQKLEKLLVLMQIMHMSRTKKKLFHEDICVWRSGVAIREVDVAFREYALECSEKQPYGLILLTEEQEKTINYVLSEFGSMDAYDINELPIIQELISKIVFVDDRRVITANIMLGFYI